jgi:hypothetical protein
MRAKTAITANTARKKEECVAFANDDFENARRVEVLLGNLSLTISAKPVGVGAASQRLIPTDEQSGLRTRTVAMASVTLCVRMKS